MEAFSPDLLIILAVAYTLTGLSTSPGNNPAKKLAREKPGDQQCVDSTSGLIPLPHRKKAFEEE